VGSVFPLSNSIHAEFPEPPSLPLDSLSRGAIPLSFAGSPTGPGLTSGTGYFDSAASGRPGSAFSAGFTTGRSLLSAGLDTGRSDIDARLGTAGDHRSLHTGRGGPSERTAGAQRPGHPPAGPTATAIPGAGGSVQKKLMGEGIIGPVLDLQVRPTSRSDLRRSVEALAALSAARARRRAETAKASRLGGVGPLDASPRSVGAAGAAGAGAGIAAGSGLGVFGADEPSFRPGPHAMPSPGTHLAVQVSGQAGLLSVGAPSGGGAGPDAGPAPAKDQKAAGRQRRKVAKNKGMDVASGLLAVDPVISTTVKPFEHSTSAFDALAPSAGVTLRCGARTKPGPPRASQNPSLDTDGLSSLSTLTRAEFASTLGGTKPMGHRDSRQPAAGAGVSIGAPTDPTADAAAPALTDSTTVPDRSVQPRLEADSPNASRTFAAPLAAASPPRRHATRRLGHPTQDGFPTGPAASASAIPASPSAATATFAPTGTPALSALAGGAPGRAKGDRHTITFSSSLKAAYRGTGHVQQFPPGAVGMPSPLPPITAASAFSPGPGLFGGERAVPPSPLMGTASGLASGQGTIKVQNNNLTRRALGLGPGGVA
jgi:hypothetical protein